MKKRTISTKTIQEAVSELCIKANVRLRPDIRAALTAALRNERSAQAKDVLKKIILNADIAREKKLPICQDTGMAVVFVTIGEAVHISGGHLETAIIRGVCDGYKKGFLRKSVVKDPLFGRVPTGDNSPPIIYYDLVPGNKIRIDVMPKGFGAENKTALTMLNPTSTEQDVENVILDVVRQAGPNACPPLVLGVGIGGTADKAIMLAKEALLMRLDRENPDKNLERFSQRLKKSINHLGVGPLGLGGKTTVLGVMVRTYPTHIAGLPVAVNVSCHATRSAGKVL